MFTPYKDPTTGKVERLYNTWRNMRQRCTNPKATRFDGYGGRGINICAEWKTYGGFKDWALANGYEEHLTIERRNTEEGYSPNNCYWATTLVQGCNKRNRIDSASSFIGVTRNRNKWAAKVRFNGHITRLGSYTSEEEAAKVRDKYITENNLPHKLNF